jgi:hypothetical protein
VQALPPAAFFLFLEAAVGGTIALFWVHLRGEVTRGFTLFTGACLWALGVLAFWLRLTFPPLIVPGFGSALVWFAAERALVLAFLVLLAVYLAGLRFSRPAERPASSRTNGAVVSRSRFGRSGGLLGILAPLVPLLGLAGLWSAALVDPGRQLGGLGAPLAVLAGAIALGTALTGLSLGHWYLVSPGLSVRPLIQLSLACLAALLVQAALVPLLLLTPGSPPGALASLFGAYGLFFGVRVVFGLLLPVAASVMTWRTARIRSLDSATGLLYIVAALVLTGEIVARSLFFLTGVAS